MNRRTNLLWLAGGVLIGALGLIVIASVITMGGTAGYARTGSQRPNIMRALAAHRVTAASQEAGGGGQKPNILFIMGDDIGWMQPSIYHRGLMVGETPNIDRIGHEGGYSWTMWPCRAARPGGTPSLRACIRCVPE
jgi:hypothetical protein